MAWDDAPPSNEELAKASVPSWDSTPPTASELAQAGPRPIKSDLDQYLDKAKDYAGQAADYAKENLPQFGKATLDALPGLGGMTGAVLGGVAAGPGGAIGGAGVGGYLGEAARNAINTYINPEEAPKSNEEYITSPIKEGVSNAAFESGGQLLGATVPTLTKKLSTTLAGVSPEATEARLAGKAGAFGKEVPNYADIAHKSADVAANLKDEIRSLDTGAWNTLSTEKNLPVSQFQEMADQAIKKITEKTGGVVVGDEAEAAIRQIQKVKDRLAQFGDNVSQAQIKGAIQQLREGINYGAQTDTPATSALKGFVSNLDQDLKEFNPAYKKAMEPVADRMKALEKLQKEVGLKREVGEGLVPSNSSESKLRSLSNSKVAEIRNEKFDPITNITGYDIPEAARDYNYAQQFENPYVNGSRRTLLGKALGGAVGGGIGALAGDQTGGHESIGAGTGALAGFMGDKYAGRVIGPLIDAYSKGIITPFGKALAEAAKRGPQALMATHEILKKTDPQYKKMAEEK